MKVMALIPARKGSERLPGKNMRHLAGVPLIGWSIIAALCSDAIERVVVSSDDPDVIRYSGSHETSLRVISRPEMLARPETPSEQVIIHTLEHQASGGYRPDVICLLQPTSPLRTAEDIRNAYDILIANNASAVVSVSESNLPWEVGFANRLRRLVPSPSARGVVVENGAIFMVRTEAFEREGLFPEITYAYRMPPERSVDIDTLADFEYAEALLAKREVVAA